MSLTLAVAAIHKAVCIFAEAVLATIKGILQEVRCFWVTIGHHHLSK